MCMTRSPFIEKEALVVLVESRRALVTAGAPPQPRSAIATTTNDLYVAPVFIYSRNQQAPPCLLNKQLSGAPCFCH